MGEYLLKFCGFLGERCNNMLSLSCEPVSLSNENSKLCVFPSNLFALSERFETIYTSVIFAKLFEIFG